MRIDLAHGKPHVAPVIQQIISTVGANSTMDRILIETGARQPITNVDVCARRVRLAGRVYKG